MGSDTDNGEIDNFNWSSDDDEEDKKNDIIPSCSSAGISIGDIAGSGGIDNFDWSSDDDEEDKKNDILPSSSSAGISLRDIARSGEASSSAGPSSSKSVSHFIGMGFSREMVEKAIKENGEGNAEAILETLLTYSALEKWPSDGQHAPSDFSSSGSERVILDDLSDDDSYFGNEENMENLTEEERTLKHLMDMGYPADEATIAMERCGSDSSIMELTDFICAAQMAKAADAHLRELPEDERPSYFNGGPSGDSREKRKRYFESEYSDNKKHRKLEKNLLIEDDSICLPNPMVGFGLPSEIPNEIPSEPWRRLSKRTIPEGAVGPPYFYYENVALAPKGVWTTISRFLYEIEPEFVDSKYFCAAARKRGYIHNLPIQNRSPLLPIPPQTINEALPLTKRWWPSWDRRTKLNCLQTCTASAKLTERLRKALENWDDEPPLRVQKYVLEECKKWNLVWVGRNKVAPLEPDEIESLLGFPKNHTRGGGISRTERLKGLGNSFQVDTVAYHLSVLRDMFPGGISVLSLFSGIGGAEVALHRLGIPLKNVVSVEISETSRSILRSWWEQTNQRGNLIDICDVQQLDADRLEQLINSFGGFDLVIGGSPCNNISGSNRVSRDGLEGKHSSLFYDYFRILNQVKAIMGK